ncbi:MAG TPA: hypothetical protein VKI17_03080 [Gemmataceae bacterium]|nr:hypothetical protein [Gemmataceae bacterium]
MNTIVVADKQPHPSAAAAKQANGKQPGAVARGRPRHTGPGGSDLPREASRQARRVAAMVLEVLAGARTPTEAAQALEVSVPRYYQLETRALRGLLSACEPIPKGRAPSLAHELARLQRDKERLQRQVLGQQALVRAAQRTVGLSPPPAPAKKAGTKTRRRLARALNVAARLHDANNANNANQENAPAEAASPGV